MSRYAQTGFRDRDPAEARVYSLARDGASVPLGLNLTLGEFAERGTDRVLVHPALRQGLQRMRERFGPIVITSAYRSRAGNAASGGALHSYHMLGMAADVRFPRLESAEGAASYALHVLGFGAVGLHRDGWMHLSVGRECGTDRMCTGSHGYVAFRNLHPDAEQTGDTAFADAAPGASLGTAAQIASTGVLGLVALGAVLATWARSEETTLRRLF